jgi:hypothetical protein
MPFDSRLADAVDHLTLPLCPESNGMAGYAGTFGPLCKLMTSAIFSTIDEIPHGRKTVFFGKNILVSSLILTYE